MLSLSKCPERARYLSRHHDAIAGNLLIAQGIRHLFGNQGLEWRLEPEAFTRREVRREDDLLDILVGCPIDIQVACQMPPFCHEA